MNKQIAFYGGFLFAAIFFGSSAIAENATVNADNTGMNVRDRNAATLTPMDQSNDSNDIAITQGIRKMLMQDNTLSVNAKNIKVITITRETTLRGPVNSEAEKAAVEQIALEVAGVGKVNNQLEVKTNS